MIGTLLILSLLQAPAASKFQAPPCPSEMVPYYWIQPIYPMNAVERRIGGKVRVEALVGADGNVTAVAPVSGDRDLLAATRDALTDWTFRPCKVDGKALEVTLPLEIEFHVGQWNVTYSITEPRFDAGEQVQADPDAPKPQRVRVSSGVTAGNLRYQVRPRYPNSAKRRYLQGTVILHAIIGRDGGLKGLEVISGPPELAEPTLDAVRQWRYKPYLLLGQPVEVDTTITVNYRLG
jgi:TonB family protein